MLTKHNNTLKVSYTMTKWDLLTGKDGLIFKNQPTCYITGMKPYNYLIDAGKAFDNI